MKKPKVALIAMPMFWVIHPSIQIGLLKAVLTKNKYPVKDFYLNLSFAELIGPELYHKIGFSSELLLGDWLFSEAAFSKSDDNKYFKAIRSKLGSFLEIQDKKILEKTITKLTNIKHKKVSKWLDEQFNRIKWSEFDVVGFSCSFSQLTASIALAKKIKENFPNIKIIFGGNELDGCKGIELAQHAFYVDCIIQGEGEASIISVLDKIKEGKNLKKIINTHKLVNLNNNPTPDYDTYYYFLDKNKINANHNLEYGAIPIESSRGCWWGEKRQCKFCGLNNKSIKYRSKTEAKLSLEMDVLSRKYNRYDFANVDNILNYKLLNEFVQNLAKNRISYRLFFEVKSNLNIDIIKTLKAANVLFLQPGIESLDSEVLTLMNKGTSLKYNLNIMKWSRYYKIDILWNFLFGFPGETEEQYNRMLALIPSLYHFQPPTTTRCIRLDRYSPYFIETVNKLKDNVTADFTGFKPSVAYKYIYPSNWNIDNLAYYFEGKAKTFVKKETYRKLIKKTQIWRDLWEAEDKPSLVFKKGFRYGNIIDNRAKKARAYELEGDAFKVASLLEESFLTFDLIRQKSKIRKNILQDILDLFIEHRLAIKTDNVYFWLPFPDH